MWLVIAESLVPSLLSLVWPGKIMALGLPFGTGNKVRGCHVRHCHKHCHRKPRVEGMQHRAQPVPSPGGHVLEHLGLGSGISERNLKEPNVPWNRATGPEGTHW